MTSAFQQYQSGALDGKDTPGQEEMKQGDVSPQPKVFHPNEFQNKALILVANQFNETFFPGVENMKTTADEFYVVWFAKTLGNWKALVSTDLISGQYCWSLYYCNLLTN